MVSDNTSCCLVIASLRLASMVVESIGYAALLELFPVPEIKFSR